MHIQKFILPISIIFGCLILGGFYYIGQSDKQKSIERQQEIRIQEDRRIESVRLQEKIEEAQAEEYKKELQDAQLQSCLDIAKQEAERKNTKALDFHNNTCIAILVKNGEATPNDCLNNFTNSLDEYKIEKEKNISDCYKRYK